MITHLFLFLIGYVTVTLDPEDAAALIKLTFEKGIPLFLGKKKKNRRIRFRERDFVFVSDLARNAGVSFLRVRVSGIPMLWRRCKKRYGLWLGGALLLAALYVSDDYVWRIEIVGNETVPDNAIIEELEEVGFYEGIYHKNIDFDVLHNRFLARSEDIAWIAVNMHGSVAYVRVREYMRHNEPIEGVCANVVAAKDGIIKQISTFDGYPDVKIGDTVNKGQLLISGVVAYEGCDTEYVYAAGEVYAETEKTVTVAVPLTRDIKCYTGEKTREYGIKIFSDDIFFGGKGRIDDPLCDTITVCKDMMLFGIVELPIKLIVTEYKPFSYETVTMTEEGARAVAYSEYKHAFIAATEDVTLLSYDVTEGLSPDGNEYVISSVIRIIENIAETKEFTVE